MKYTKYIDEHIKSLDGKIIVITGANSGIGFTLAKQILYKGGHVVMACRSLDRANKAKESLLEEFPSGKVDILQYDQSSQLSLLLHKLLLHNLFYPLLFQILQIFFQ